MIVSPLDYGMPAKYTQFRPGQLDLADRLLDSPKRVLAVSAPTGFGKSFLYVLYHLMSSGGTSDPDVRTRSAILTADKGLQDQIMDDFHECDMLDVRGRNSYRCEMSDDGEEISCEDGKLLKCPSTSGSPDSTTCPYRLALGRWVENGFGPTNYSYWTTMHQYGRGLGKFDNLVCDEAHKLPQIIEDMVAVKLMIRRHMRCPRGTDKPAWRKWAADTARDVKHNIRNIEAAYQSAFHMPMGERKKLKRQTAYLQKLKRIVEMPDDWIVDRYEDRIQFNPLWPRGYTESTIFRDIPKVLLISATLVPKTLEILGLREDEYEYFDVDTDWDPSYQPVYYTSNISMNFQQWRSGGPGMRRLWVDLIDQIIQPRLDRKGIVHTVSYELTKLVLSESAYKDRMISHESGGRDEAVQRFKEAGPGSILVSPSVTTGYSFDDDLARYQIIAKMPFPSNKERATLAKMRREEDADYDNYLAFQDLVQACGRPRRSRYDWAETFITDSRAGMIWSHKDLVPGWFLRCVQKVKGRLPDPIPLEGP